MNGFQDRTFCIHGRDNPGCEHELSDDLLDIAQEAAEPVDPLFWFADRCGSACPYLDDAPADVEG